MKIKTLIVVACCMLAHCMSVSASSKNSSDTISFFKNDYPRQGYRAFLDFGAYAGDFDMGVSISNVHGAQIIPQLFVGVGGMADVVFVEDDSHDLWRTAAFLDVRYDALKNKVTPFVDCRVGYSWGEFDIDYGFGHVNFGGEGFYFSPSIGCRTSHFNFSLFYDYQKYDWRYGEETFSNYGFRIGWDFGSRWKSWDQRREYTSQFRNTRPELAGKQPRMIVQHGFMYPFDDECDPRVWNVSVVRGQQIIPQLMVGGGFVFEHLGFTRYDLDAWTDDGIRSDYDVTAGSIIPVISIRYDILKTPITPYIETKAGGRIKLMHSRNSSIPVSSTDILYIVPSLGVRLYNFNMSASFENQNVVVDDVKGRYKTYSFTKNIQGIMFHLGFDFGAREHVVKNKK